MSTTRSENPARLSRWGRRGRRWVGRSTTHRQGLRLVTGGWAVLAILLLIAFAPGIGAEETCTLSGRVELADGSDASGLTVRVWSSARSSYEAETLTLAEGRFEVGDVPLGELTICVYDGEEELVVEGETHADGADSTCEITLSEDG